MGDNNVLGQSPLNTSKTPLSQSLTGNLFSKGKFVIGDFNANERLYGTSSLPTLANMIDADTLMNNGRDHTATFSNAHNGLGLVLKHTKSRLFVKMIKEGPVSRWNAMNPINRIIIGDEIMGVNDVKDDTKVMVHELSKAGSVRLSLRRPVLFKVILDKGGSSLGLTLRKKGVEKDLLVEAVAAGKCEEWNRQHPEHEVIPGDIVIEVNGYQNVARMVEAVVSESHLEIVLQRSDLT